MNNQAILLDYLPWVRAIAASKLKRENGESSVYDDIVQEVLTRAMERNIMGTEAEVKDFLYKEVMNYLARHREHGYRQQMWQNSVNEEFSEAMWGDNPDFE